MITQEQLYKLKQYCSTEEDLVSATEEVNEMLGRGLEFQTILSILIDTPWPKSTKSPEEFMGLGIYNRDI